MNKLLTIKNKLIAIAALVTLGMLGILGLQHYSTSVIHDLQETRLLTTQIESGILMLRRHEKDFLARMDLKYQKKFNDSLAQTLEIVDRQINNLQTQGIDSRSATRTREVLQDYGNKFNTLIKVEQTIGLDHKSGLNGALRAAVHDAEEKVKSFRDHQLSADMLMLRRHEKDFMLRWDMKYLNEFNKDFETFTTHLSERDYPAARKQEISTLMQAYRERLTSLAKGAQEKGLSITPGIHGKMRDTIHQAETLLASMDKKLAAIVASKQNQLTVISLAIAVLLLNLVIISVALVAISITRPIYRLRKIMQTVAAHKDLKLRSDIHGHDEISQMSDAFNNMIEVLDHFVHEVSQSTAVLAPPRRSRP